MKNHIAAAMLAAAALAAACGGRGTVLETVEGRATVVEERAGVEMAVTGGKWEGKPARLQETLTPLRVAIRNRSGRPLRVRFREFKLLSPAGRRYDAIPPYEMEATAKKTVILPVSPAFTYDRFSVVPYAADLYVSGPPRWVDPFPYDWSYYGPHYGQWPSHSVEVDVPLPTADMVARALPEGVIEDGGEASGFVYLQKLPSELAEVTFQADLVDARTGEFFGAISAPFRVKRRPR